VFLFTGGSLFGFASDKISNTYVKKKYKNIELTTFLGKGADFEKKLPSDFIFNFGTNRHDSCKHIYAKPL
jgi:hypothetical protein